MQFQESLYGAQELIFLLLLGCLRRAILLISSDDDSEPQISGDFVHCFSRNHRRATGVSGKQRILADRIYQSRKAVRVPKYRASCRLGKDHDAWRHSGNLETALNVSPRLFQIEGFEVAAQCNPLLDLPEFK